MSRPPFEERQHELNPHRDEDRAHAAEMAYSQLKQRGISVTGDESADDLASLLEAVERFEGADCGAVALPQSAVVLTAPLSPAARVTPG